MDEAIRLPGGFRIGLDGIVGLIPGIGDAFGMLVSGYIVLAAAREGAPKRVLARMLANIGLESVVGLVPIIGDAFDFVYKANSRNLRLFEDYGRAPAPTASASGRWLAMAIIAMLAALAAVATAAVLLVRILVDLIS
jgi:hypothetical protein